MLVVGAAVFAVCHSQEPTARGDPSSVVRLRALPPGAGKTAANGTAIADSMPTTPVSVADLAGGFRKMPAAQYDPSSEVGIGRPRRPAGAQGPVIVGIMDSVISGVLAAIACQGLGGTIGLQIAVGVLGALVAGAMLGIIGYRRLARRRRDLRPRFPS